MQTKLRAVVGLAILLIASVASAGQPPIITRDADRRATIPSYPALKNRAFVVKVTRLFRF